MPRSLDTTTAARKATAKAAVAALIHDYLDDSLEPVQFLAARAGLSKMSVYRYLKAEMLIDPDACRALARAMGLPVETLLTAAGYADVPANEHVPDLDDPVLAVYLRHIGLVSSETRQAIKDLLRDEYHKMDTTRAAIALRATDWKVQTMGLYNDITFTASHVTPYSVKTATDLIDLYDLHRDPALPVDIAPLLVDFDLRFMDLPPATWGFTLDMERTIIIALNSNLTPDQTRFTAMHEIGHVALWHPNQLNMCVTDPTPTRCSKPKRRRLRRSCLCLRRQRKAA